MVFRQIFWTKSSITAHSVPKSFSTSKNSNPTNPNTMACGSLDKNWNNISAKLVWKCSAGNAITLPIVKRRIMKLYPCIMLMPSNVILAKWSSQVCNFGLFFKNVGHKNWNNISAKLVWKCSAGNAITLPIVKRRIMKLYPCIMLMLSNVTHAKWSSQVRTL